MGYHPNLAIALEKTKRGHLRFAQDDRLFFEHVIARGRATKLN
jgi:hypothetical protein